MNEKYFFRKSTSFLIVACLVILAFFPQPQYQWMFFAVFGIWGASFFVRFIARRFMWLGRLPLKIKVEIISRKAKKAQQKVRIQSVLAVEPEMANDKHLLGHISCRITEKLKSVFPDAIWKWQNANPGRISEGELVRICVECAGDYTHADVKVDKFYRISFVMMKIACLNDITSEAVEELDDTISDETVQVNISDWYDWLGKEILHDVITDLNIRGYSKLFVKENGDIYVVEDGDESVQANLKDMPGKSKWVELIEVLAAGDLRGEVDNDRLTVAWA